MMRSAWFSGGRVLLSGPCSTALSDTISRSDIPLTETVPTFSVPLASTAFSDVPETSEAPVWVAPEPTTVLSETPETLEGPVTKN